MTICIAAICDEKYVVVVTDRMITVIVPNIEYEQRGRTKAIEVTPNCIATTAGSALAYTPIFRDAKIDIDKGSIKAIGAIAEITRRSYTKARDQVLEEAILGSVGLSLDTFYERNKDLQPSLAANIFQRMQTFKHPLWIIIAGADDTGGHIWHIETPGRKVSFDNMGFHAIGSGQHHAISTFIANEFDPTIDLSHGVAIAFEAKRRSEKATGVGKSTDLLIIDKNGHRRLTDKEIEKLNEIYEKRLEIEKAAVTELDKMIKNLAFLKKR